MKIQLFNKYINYKTLEKTIDKLPRRALGEKTVDEMYKLTESAFRDRLPVALTAVIFITLIDYYNTTVDKHTRKSSAVKTFVKDLVGGAGGLLSRSWGQKYGERWAKEGKIKRSPEMIKKIKLDPALEHKFIKSSGKAFGFLFTLLEIVFIDFPFINKGIDYAFTKLSLHKKKEGVKHD